MKFLPDCLLRSETDENEVYYCRHSQMHAANNLVTGQICRACTWYDQLCSNPRPEINELKDDPAPTIGAMAIGLATSAIAFVADGLKVLSEEQTADRLQICATCDENQGNWCRRCGCNLTLKARGRAFECPLDKWPRLFAENESQKPSVQ